MVLEEELTHAEPAKDNERPRNTGFVPGVLEKGTLGPSLASG